MSHEYTVTTPHGDVNLTTPHHHSMFETIDDFLKHHHDRIMEALGVTGIAVTSLGLYLSHGRGGNRLK